ncbi:spore germination protein [Acetohalobium arabaticum]|uniref:GerA spore germination protein n=1 Tax=Acetohalobium arabaticum (strain ATCC 49924 / DSM 5501 / Z-7288) TaxID=574087 RepID=D9QRA8_ACEAZ|nr:spore germination protein [Acetohalobium arabaticum]ADL13049.1 GerA spore germination protein [Acetohalobium arabaticum DSM 5501]
MWQQLKKWLQDKYIAQQNEKEDTADMFFNSLAENEAVLKKRLDKIDDVRFRDIKPADGDNNQLKMTLVYITDLVDKEIINNHILKPILSHKQNSDLEALIEDKDAEVLKNQIIDAEDMTKLDKIEKAITDLMAGKSILLIDQTPYVFSIATQGWEERSVPDPVVERTVRGPNVSFMENIKTNTGLIRRRIKDDNLKIEPFTKGRQTKTKINVIYLDGVANQKIVKEVKKRIESIEVAGINSAQHLLELIEDNPLSPFETVYLTQRPDIISAGLLEGRVAILIDGTPTVLTVPKLFMENLISPEDYYSRIYYTLVIRIIRFSAFLVAATLPAFYISLLGFHQEVLPLTLVNSIYTAREGVPFPIAVEMIVYGLFFEGIREAGARIPTGLGSSVTIVGALILGQAAISAGFLSPDGVIIGSLTGIAVFLTPTLEFSNTLLILRLLFVGAASIAGFYGMTILFLLVTMHLTSLRSFGVPYTKPIAPLQLTDLRDFFIRVPYLLMNTRPESLENEDQTRQDNQPSRRFFFKYKLTEDD